MEERKAVSLLRFRGLWITLRGGVSGVAFGRVGVGGETPLEVDLVVPRSRARESFTTCDERSRGVKSDGNRLSEVTIPTARQAGSLGRRCQTSIGSETSVNVDRDL
jgi:hypothetical protein